MKQWSSFCLRETKNSYPGRVKSGTPKGEREGGGCEGRSGGVREEAGM